VSLDVRLLITRSQGTKVLSSRPYMLTVTAGGGNSQLNLGNEVPVATSTAAQAADDKAAPVAVRSFNYRSVGTSIDVTASGPINDAFELSINIDDSAVAASGAASGSLPTVRTYRSRNRVTLKSGESREYTVATDPLTGESIKVLVDLQLAKSQAGVQWAPGTFIPVVP
jgi:hypothetical protein